MPVPAQGVPVVGAAFTKKEFSFDKIEKYIADVTEFRDALLKKHENLLKQTSVVIEANTSRMKDVPDDPIGKKRIFLYARNIIHTIEDRAKHNFNFNKDYFSKTGKRKVFAVLRFLDDFSDKKNEKYIALQTKYNTLIDSFHTANVKFYKNLEDIRASLNIEPYITKLTTEDYVDLNLQFQDLDRLISVTGLPTKIKSYYNLNYSLMDVIIDSQFFLMYILKGLRIFLSYIALFLTTRIFIPMYEEAVYDKKSTPPGLWKYLLIFFGFDVAFNSFLLVILYTLKLLFNTPDNSFVIDSYLFSKFMTDYFVTVSLVILLSLAMSAVIINKKYFKYKYEGARAIRAFEKMVFYVAIVIYLFPFFLIV